MPKNEGESAVISNGEESSGGASHKGGLFHGFFRRHSDSSKTSPGKARKDQESEKASKESHVRILIIYLVTR